jgi:hypothetical protein
VRALVDTSALLALAHARDQYHARAVKIARAHHASGGRYVGTFLVLAEFHAHLLYLRGPEEAREAVRRLSSDPQHDWRAVSGDHIRGAIDRWLGRFPDQTFSLADAVSFELMRELGLKQAFAFDKHFEVAGFSLLR